MAAIAQKSVFLAAPALSSLEQARAVSTTVSLPAFQAKQQRRSVVATAALTARDLQTKSLEQLRAIARQKGIVGNSKGQLIAALTGNAVAAKPASYGGAAPAAAVSGDEAVLQGKSLGELRALAAAKGLRGDTKAEIIKLLLSAGGLAPTPSPTPISISAEARTPVVPAAASVSDYQRRLQVKPMSKLRAVARMRGVVGNTRAELVAGLLAFHSKSGAAGAQAAAQDKPEIVGQLESLALSELRALAKARGVRGDTRKELIKLLTGTDAPKAAAPAAVSYTNGSAVASSSHSSPSYSAPASYSASTRPNARDLATKSLAQLRAIAAQRGIRGNTKQELVKALTS
ncbi:hypothetical protein CLOM_g15076 [Closterium sp. NIES-68]|nr:hypothetical protein CLOM_g12146 [Closterium sp. NIES-68]GJP56027.1 hypothetical protein CLOM_g15076 [Closterium sp. NIES-68]